MMELIEKNATEDEVAYHDFPKLYEAQRPELPQIAGDNGLKFSA